MEKGFTIFAPARKFICKGDIIYVVSSKKNQPATYFLFSDVIVSTPCLSSCLPFVSRDRDDRQNNTKKLITCPKDEDEKLKYLTHFSLTNAIISSTINMAGSSSNASKDQPQRTDQKEGSKRNPQRLCVGRDGKVKERQTHACRQERA